jgi:hypothetical protein
MYTEEDSLFRWDHSRIDFAEWDLNENVFKRRMDQLDRLHELEDEIADYEDKMDVMRAVAFHMDLHPTEVPRVDGIGTMEELMFHKTLALRRINYLREKLPVLLNTD